MKRNFTLSIFTVILLFSNATYGQMVGDNIFLKGKSCEVGIAPNGAYGSTEPAPTGYHPNVGDAFSSLYDPATGDYTALELQIGFVADPDQDGWTVGTPPMIGDYFVPGTPQEGWSIQVNGVESDGWLETLSSFGSTGYTGTLSGTSLSYTSSGSRVIGVWQGSTTDPLLITQTTTLDTNKLYFLVNVVIKNTGTTTAPAVYYMRTVDPDNTEAEYGASDFTTNNTITYQLPNPENKVMVSATGYSDAAAYLGLGTKDCRAKCFILDAGLTPYNPMDAVYSESTAYTYAVGTGSTSDVGIGLIYNLGDIAAGDSTSLTYTYVLRASDLDSAINETNPTVEAAGVLLGTSDTVNACTLAIDTIPITIENGGAYTWHWYPGTGLTDTIGISVDIIPSELTGVTIYTIIGVPSSAGLCANDTFHVTVLPGTASGPGVTPVYYCQYATADTLTAIGTSLLWYTSATGGTGSPTAPLPNTSVIGVTTYYVSQTSGVCGESIRVPITVTITAPPVIHAGSNSPICQNGILTLTTTDTLTTGTVYDWSGPGGFTSAAQDTTIYGVPLSMAGTYTVTVSAHGCVVTDSTVVVVNPSPVITSVSDVNPSGCGVHDGLIVLSGLNPDSTYLVYYTEGSTTYSVTLTANASGEVIITGLPSSIYGSIYVISTSGCPSNIVSTTLSDPLAPPAPTASSNTPICADSTLNLFATDPSSGVVYHWSGPGGFSASSQNPSLPDAQTYASGIYSVTVTDTITGCSSGAGTTAVIVKPTPTIPVITSNGPVCAGSILELSVTSSPGGDTYSWTGPDAFTSALQNPEILNAQVVNSGIYTVTAVLNGCSSLPGTGTIVVNPIPDSPATTNITYCQYDVAAPLTAGGSTLLWYTTATGGTGTSTAPVPNTSLAGNTTWYVSQVVAGCESGRTPLIVTVHTKPVVSITPARGFVCQSDTLTLRFSGIPLAGASYSWSFPTGATVVTGSDTTQGPLLVRFDTAGFLPVTLTVNANGCTTTSTFTVHVVATPVTGLYINPNVCIGDTVTAALTLSGPPSGYYVWNFDSASVITTSGSGGPYSISWATAGIYTVAVTAYTSQECRSQTKYDTVDVHGLPDATFAGAGPLCTGDSILLNANTSLSGNSYLWGPSAFFPGIPNTPTIYGILYEAGYVSLTVTDPYGCHATDSMYYNPSSCCSVTFPDAFSPNSDGLNDVFRPIGDGHHELNIFRIVDRWGVTMYETTTTDGAGWDGTHGGVPQDIGTYYWYIRYTCGGTTIEHSGNVTLIR